MEREKTSKKLENLKGKILIFGGVYSNLQALEALLTIAKEEGITSQNMICTGDIVGYCAQPNECLELLKENEIKTIAGNVEIQLREEQEDCGCDFTDGGRCDIFSKNWYAYAQQKLDPKFIPWLKELPDFLEFNYAGKKTRVVHGSYHHTSEFIFKSTEWSTKAKNFKDSDSEIIIAGHCGLPFYENQEGSLWLNPGVIGMPANDGETAVWFGILDDENEELSFEFLNYEYDHDLASNLMLENNLPKTYAQTLRTGIWDNCEILPDLETNSQGEALEF